MLTGLRIGNFKAFAEEQHIPIRPITLIFGANSSGKSSIIHSLLLANHALDTGDWDVHQPRLGAESVDLGGFPHYAHQHRSGEFLIHFESDPSKVDLLTQLAGPERERTPFCAFREFGLSLRVGRCVGGGGTNVADNALAIQTAEITIDGRTALCMTRTTPGSFQCNRIDSDHPFVGQLLRVVPALVRKSFREEDAARKRTMDELAGAGGDADSVGRGASVEGADALALKEEFKPVLGSARVPDETAELARILSGVLAERQFRLRQFRLWDDGPDSDWWYPGWHEQLADGSPCEFFRQYGDELWGLAQGIRYNLTRLVAVLTKLTNQELLKLSYLGPQRVVPPRHLLALAQDSSTSSGSGFEAWKRVFLDVRAQEAVNRWFGAEWLQLPYRLKVRRLVDVDEPTANIGISELLFEDVNTGIRLSHCDLGFGVTQALPVLVNAAALSNRIIAVEQPELHLHPAQQAELGDVFIESALGERKNTFLLETHSEHLILRIMRRIRESARGTSRKGLPRVRPQDVAVVFVESHKQGDKSGSFVRVLQLDEEGGLLDPWPGGFFEEGFRERFS